MGLHFETGTCKESERHAAGMKARAVRRPPKADSFARFSERPVAGRGEMTALDFFDYFF